MSLKDDLLPVVDAMRAIAGELGFRPYQVFVRRTVWSGARVGLGTSTTTETRLLVGGQNPKVREVRRADVIAGTAELIEAEYDIGPLTPSFAGGGVAETVIDPPNTGQPATLVYILKGPGLPTTGLLCEKIADRMDRPLRMVIRVKSLGRKNP